MRTFADYVREAGLDESDILTEALSGAVAKTAAVGILMKISRMRQNIAQDRTATSAEKSLASMLFFLAGMLTVAIGAIDGDPDLVSRAKRIS